MPHAYEQMLQYPHGSRGGTCPLGFCLHPLRCLIPSDRWANEWVSADVCGWSCLVFGPRVGSCCSSRGRSLLALSFPILWALSWSRPPLVHDFALHSLICTLLEQRGFWLLDSRESGVPAPPTHLDSSPSHFCYYYRALASCTAQSFSRGLANFQRSEEQHLEKVSLLHPSIGVQLWY